jgi:hypothetical protein
MAESRVLHSQGWTFLSLMVIVPLGFSTKFYQGPAAPWINDSLSGVFYEVFWCLLIFLFLPQARPGIIALAVLVLTCFLEFLQLWHRPFLEYLRSFFVGRTILGTTFAWTDFPYYFLGSGIGWFWLRQLRNLD